MENKEQLELLEKFQSYINRTRSNIRISATDIVEFLNTLTPQSKG